MSPQPLATIVLLSVFMNLGFPGGLAVKNQPTNAGDTGDTGLIPGSGRSPGEGSDNPLQYSCLGNPMNRGAWPATVHRITKQWDRTKQPNNNKSSISGVSPKHALSLQMVLMKTPKRRLSSFPQGLKNNPATAVSAPQMGTQCQRSCTTRD